MLDIGRYLLLQSDPAGDVVSVRDGRELLRFGRHLLFVVLVTQPVQLLPQKLGGLGINLGQQRLDRHGLDVLQQWWAYRVTIL